MMPPSRSELLLALAALATVGCSGATGPVAQEPAASAASYAAGSRPQSVAVADLDGDGHHDVVVANAGDGTVRLYLGGPDGRLRPQAHAVPAGNEPSDVEAVDLDGDRDLDLVIANHETSRVTVLLNDGRAGFSPAPGSPYESGARPHLHGLATGDFDGDGWNDVAVESSGGRELRILPGGPAGLGEARGVAVDATPYHRLGAADMTGDGRVEILVPGHESSRVLIVAGGHAVIATLPLAGSARPWMVVGDDVNGDGRKDVVVVVTDGVSVLLAGPTGFMEAPGSPFAVAGATEVATGDLDGDGIADIVVGPWNGADVTVLTGGTFRRQTVRTCERPIGLAVSDLNRDGRNELIAACAAQDRLWVVTDPLGRRAPARTGSPDRSSRGR